MRLLIVLFIGALGGLPGASTVALAAMDDRFDGSAIDTCRWEISSYRGAAAQSDALVLTTPGASSGETARVLSQSRLVGDFDIQVDYRRIAGFSPAPPSPAGGFAQLRAVLGLWWDESRIVQLARLRHSNGEAAQVYSTLPESAAGPSPWLDVTGEAGTLRIVRAGTRTRFLHRAAGGAFVEVGSLTLPATPVFVFLQVDNLDVARALNAQFDDFLVNAGRDDDIDWTPPTTYFKRPGFALGGVSESWPVLPGSGRGPSGLDALTLFRQNGMEWMRVGVTTWSHPELEAPSWASLAWRDSYWGAREYAARTLADAKARGMRLYAYLYFSDQAANWGNQKAPEAWAGKSVDETAALMEQHAYETATYFKSRGLDVEIYELGNETDIGMVDFLPWRRIAVPPGVDFVNDRTWLRENVWSTQATLLKAAAKGIRRAAPDARIAVHASSLESGSGQQMGPDFFAAMRDFGVDYDIAAISHPYAQGPTPWKLSQYTTACWQKRFARIVDRIAVPGKPVMMVEASYQSSPAALVSAPMPAFPFSPAGQADFAREMFRFASSHPSIAGWFWFYPDFQFGNIDPADDAYVLKFGSLLGESFAPRPALAEFRVNLGPPSANTVEYHHAGIDHYFLTADPDEVAGIDGGAYGGVWKRTGRSFMSYPRAVAGTVPVCRFYSTAFGAKAAHFYTASAAECEWVKHNPHWQFEKIAFHALVPDAAGACVAGTEPVYRMFNNGRTGAPNHRFTTDAPLRDEFVQLHGFAGEGVAMCAPR